MAAERRYSQEPRDKERFTTAAGRFYSRFAGAYDIAVRLLPIWKEWLDRALPHIQGPRVLEVSFGTGYLLTRYAGKFETFGIDYSEGMVETARRNLSRAGLSADLRRGNVESMPYEDGMFDSIVNTMSFSGYPDSRQAMSEMHRVLKDDGRLILIDVNYPQDGNRVGTALTNLWKLTGDMIRDMAELFRTLEFDFRDEEIGGFGSVHLYLASKRRSP